jgi:hypothetical protein
VTLAVAVLALFLALLSAVFSWRAASKAADSADKINALVGAQAGPGATAAAQPTAQPTAEVGPTDETTAQPTDPPTGSVPILDAQTQYKGRYLGQSMKIPAGCGDTIYLDLDEPRVQVDSGIGELAYEDPCGPPSPKFRLLDGVTGSEVQSESVRPVTCADQIVYSPLSLTADQPIRRGQVFCIKTSIDAAHSSAISWKMVVMSVTATAQDGTVTLKVSAWDIPG